MHARCPHKVQVASVTSSMLVVKIDGGVKSCVLFQSTLNQSISKPCVKMAIIFTFAVDIKAMIYTSASSREVSANTTCHIETGLSFLCL